ncbi:hypothetical protein HPB48_025179 [Haemaphysalis longicornis]|uniref:Uncharacterized protein n=1 Tax=Haemaphysalis longicornis TaxID=44386 RepID=A0A9J6H9Z7_HAELO|nr:hypothetical protein HPB48_025179 [Haemaphysalis longicornis]
MRTTVRCYLALRRHRVVSGRQNEIRGEEKEGEERPPSCASFFVPAVPLAPPQCTALSVQVDAALRLEVRVRFCRRSFPIRPPVVRVASPNSRRAVISGPPAGRTGPRHSGARPDWARSDGSAGAELLTPALFIIGLSMAWLKQDYTTELCLFILSFISVSLFICGAAVPTNGVLVCNAEAVFICASEPRGAEGMATVQQQRLTVEREGGSADCALGRPRAHAGRLKWRMPMRAALMPSLAKQRLPGVTEPKVRLHQVRRPRSDRPREPPPAKCSGLEYRDIGAKLNFMKANQSTSIQCRIGRGAPLGASGVVVDRRAKKKKKKRLSLVGGAEATAEPTVDALSRSLDVRLQQPMTFQELRL